MALGRIEADSAPAEIDVGQRLRQLRVAAGLSQRALAKKAGVSNATISMVESNQVSPSISALKQILSGFPLGIAEFFSAPEPDVDQVVFRASEFTEIAGGPVSYRQVGANLGNRQLQILHERYQPGAESGRPRISHQGEEGGVVIKGRLQLEVDDRRYELGPGDAYLFDSRRPHAFRNIGDGELVIVSACTPPSF